MNSTKVVSHWPYHLQIFLEIVSIASHNSHKQDFPLGKSILRQICPPHQNSFNVRNTYL